MSRKHIIESVQASLSRLQLSYIDIVMIHKVDPMCPMEGESFNFSTNISLLLNVKKINVEKRERERERERERLWPDNGLSYIVFRLLHTKCTLVSVSGFRVSSETRVVCTTEFQSTLRTSESSCTTRNFTRYNICVIYPRVNSIYSDLILQHFVVPESSSKTRHLIPMNFLALIISFQIINA